MTLFNSNLKFVKLNRKYSGAEHYQYRIEFNSILPYPRRKTFVDLRNYLLTTYGNSCELDFIDCYSTTPVWCWKIKDKFTYFIYVTEGVCAHIMLIKEKFERD